MKRVCEWCGKEFIPYNRRPNQKYCSKKCNAKQYRETHKEKIKQSGKHRKYRKFIEKLEKKLIGELVHGFNSV